MLIDTGAGISTIPTAVFDCIPADKRPPVQPSRINIYSGNGARMTCSGAVELEIEIGSEKYKELFHIVKEDAKGIIGTNFMHRHNVTLQMRQRKMFIGSREVTVYNNMGVRIHHRVIVHKNVTVPAGTRLLIAGKVKGKADVSGRILTMDPARTLYGRTGVFTPRTIVRPLQGIVPIEVYNASDVDILLDQGTVVGILAEADELQLWEEKEQFDRDTVNEQKEADSRDTASGASDRDTIKKKVSRDTTKPVRAAKKRQRHKITKSRSNSTKVTEDAASQFYVNELTQKMRGELNLHQSANSAVEAQNSTAMAGGERTNTNKKKKNEKVENQHQMHEMAEMTQSAQNAQSVPKCQKGTSCTTGYKSPILTIDAPDGTTLYHRLVEAEQAAAAATELPPHLIAMYEANITELNQQQAASFKKLLCDYQDIFAKNKLDLGKCNLVKHHIDTGTARPTKQHARRMPQVHYEEARRHIAALADTGIIVPSDSPWGANVILVKKKDGTWRMCVDYRDLNSKTINVDPYLLPRIDDTIESLGQAKFFCTLDLIQGYHQVELSDEAKPKTAFILPRMQPSQWQYNYMPFGVQGGPSTFQRLMDRLLAGLDRNIALAYLDDIIVFGPTIEGCIESLAKVFQRVREANLKLKPKKCEFFKKEILYLGHVVSADGIKCDPAKVEAIERFRRPTTPRGVMVFVGTVNYYNRFIKDFSAIAKPLFELKKKSRKFEWTQECQEAFDTLRTRLTSAPVMAYPIENGRYVLDTDASAYAIGAVLSQYQPDSNGEEQERVIAYGSRSLHPREQRYCTRRRELLAIVAFAKSFRPYLYGRRVLIRTDHASLKYIKTLKDPNDQFARWIERLEDMQYEIEVRPGVQHCNADGLSRIPCDGKRCICEGVQQLEDTGDTSDDFTVLSPAMLREDPQAEAVVIRCFHTDCPNRVNESNIGRAEVESNTPEGVNAATFTQLWTLEDMASEQERDPDIAVLYKAKQQQQERPTYNEISGGSEALNMYWHEWRRLKIIDGVMYREWESRDGNDKHWQVVLPYKYREIMMQQFHDAPTAAHMGVRRTFNHVHRRAFWFRMADDLKFWIRTCEICQRRKRPGKTTKAPQCIYSIGQLCQRVSLDVCGPLCETPRGNRHILVITDQFSKYTRAFPMADHKAETIAEIFHKEWICIFGAPRQVHSDQGRDFESHVFRQMCKMFGCEKTRTTSYHPSSDGQVERYNSTMADMISALTSANRYEWDQVLPYTTFAYNSTRHSTTDIEPNKIMLGWLPRLPYDVMTPAPPEECEMQQNEYVREVQKRMRFIHQLAREKAGRAATVIKRYNDRSTNLNKYKPGDLVALRMYIRAPGTGKIDFKWTKPYTVIDAISDLSFRVAASAEAKPLVVHHDRLRPWYVRSGEENDTSWAIARSRRQKSTVDSEVQVGEPAVAELAMQTQEKVEEGKKEEKSQVAQVAPPCVIEKILKNESLSTSEIEATSAEKASHPVDVSTDVTRRNKEKVLPQRRSRRLRRAPERLGIAAAIPQGRMSN